MTSAPTAAPAVAGASPFAPYEAPRYRWQTRYVALLVCLDAVALAAGFGVGLAQGERLGPLRESLAGSLGASAVLSVAWLLLLWGSRAYEERFLGTGSEEYRRVIDASLRLVAGLAAVVFALKLSVSRLFVLESVGSAGALLVLGRYAARRALYRLRQDGRCAHRVVVAGDAAAVVRLARQLDTQTAAGFQVIGACTPSGREQVLAMHDGVPLPVLGSVEQVLAAVRTIGGDTVAIASSHAFDDGLVKRVSWDLEGSGVDLVVAPGLVDVAGPRVHVRPVAGLPLLHVEEPELAGARRVLKQAFDVCGALALLVLTSPLLLLLAIAVGTTSRGGVLFRQTRVGLRGQEFRAWKFRSMVADAEAMLPQLQERNEHDGVLFKLRADPRVTPVGRFLRKTSLDELPQLVNVLRGQMSLVGPRPPLPAEVERYQDDVRRRLLVRPGITGLWQVSGRSDLSWDDTVRLDLYYVENWSLALDFQILWRTLWVVLRGSGAY